MQEAAAAAAAVGPSIKHRVWCIDTGHTHGSSFKAWTTLSGNALILLSGVRFPSLLKMPTWKWCSISHLELPWLMQDVPCENLLCRSLCMWILSQSGRGQCPLVGCPLPLPLGPDRQTVQHAMGAEGRTNVTKTVMLMMRCKKTLFFWQTSICSTVIESLRDLSCFLTSEKFPDLMWLLSWNLKIILLSKAFLSFDHFSLLQKVTPFRRGRLLCMATALTNQEGFAGWPSN